MNEMDQSNEITFKEITKILKKNKAELQNKYKVKDIGMFGSYVRGEQQDRSDVDILVEFNYEDIPGLFKFIELEGYIEKLIKRKVDLVRRGAIRAELKDIILKEVVYL